MERAICLHGHFYQPPRQNPWLEMIEAQDSARPYHDWNARITAECYAPNAAARILDSENRILRILNNYSRISFNIGPTLLAWMEQQAPQVYQAILAADRESQIRYAGHGSALAQAYNHLIMPLANRRDKETQILWGIRDFVQRFGRQPEGMWLPETAVDLETLDLLAAHEIRFTILAPSQARRVRALGDTPWRTVSDGSMDTTMAYTQRLPSGRQISVFFYHAPLSRAIAFERLLQSGPQFVDRLMAAFAEQPTHAQLVHLATDGETYGHHHRFGEMALAYALDYIETHKLAQLTNYGAYLAQHPPTHEVEILENTSWSCAHGIERWRSNCGCRSDASRAWQQTWRTGLRDAMNWLRDTLAPRYERRARQVFRAPWQARDDYISVVLSNTPEQRDTFLKRHATQALTEADSVAAWQLLELQHQAMLMYTSCGWFFDEISGLESRQVLLHAARAVQLAQTLGLGHDLETQLLTRLAQAQSNLPAQGDGRRIYTRWVRPAMVRWEEVASHYAVRLLMTPSPAPMGCYTARIAETQRYPVDHGQFLVGWGHFTSTITGETAALAFALFWHGEHHLYSGAHTFQADTYHAVVQAAQAAHTRTAWATLLRRLRRQVSGRTYTIRGLRRDMQREVMAWLMRAHVETMEAAYRRIYTPHLPFLRLARRLALTPPQALQAAAVALLHGEMQRLLDAADLDLERLTACVTEGRAAGLQFEAATLQPSISQALERLAQRLATRPDSLAEVQRLDTALQLVKTLPFGVDLRPAQDLCYALWETTYPALRRQAEAGDTTARLWLQHFRRVNEGLAMRLSA